MGVIGIFRGMGKNFRVAGMLFIYLKVASKKSVPEPPVNNYYCD